MKPKYNNIYVVGDIHGSYDLLDLLLSKINSYSLKELNGLNDLVIFLGDYISRGPNSFEVIEKLITFKRSFLGRCIFLKGNHEEELFNFLLDPYKFKDWITCGGEEFLKSYGISSSLYENLYKLTKELKCNIPKDHFLFLKSLKLYFYTKSYFFVHAGVNPSQNILHQTSKEYLWIREPFLSSKEKLSKIVIHGHTVERKSGKINIKNNRIGIDTCAHETGILSCLVLQNDNQILLMQTPLLKLSHIELPSCIVQQS